MAANASSKNLTDYQYSLYQDYLDQMDGILTKYGQQSGLSIEYWHIRVNESKNYDELRMQNSYKHFVYDLYHFVPTINMTPLTYQIGYDPNKQGTSNTASGSFSMYLLDQPLPGDVFRFYPYDGTTERTEIFRITNVRYMRTSNNKLKLYQLDFETAPMTVETLEHVRINEIFCWDTENHQFLNEALCSSKSEIIDCRDKLVELINGWYDEQNGWYGLCKGDGTTIDWEAICDEDTPEGPEWPGQPDQPNWPEWPPGPGWPGWPEEPPGWSDEEPPATPEKSCGGASTARPLVFLNTVLKRLKKIIPTLDVQPIYGIGTAKIPIEWMMPAYLAPDPDSTDGTMIWMQRDYWDTFSCLSYQPQSTSGELFNVTQILNGDCSNCPPELVEEIECHRELYILVTTLVKLLSPLLTDEQMKDNTCDRKCCDQFDANFVGKCISWASGGGQTDFNDLFWSSEGSGAGATAPVFCERYENANCGVPLYITWRDGPTWPGGGRVIGD